MPNNEPNVIKTKKIFITLRPESNIHDCYNKQKIN